MGSRCGSGGSGDQGQEEAEGGGGRRAVAGGRETENIMDGESDAENCLGGEVGRGSKTNVAVESEGIVAESIM